MGAMRIVKTDVFNIFFSSTPSKPPAYTTYVVNYVKLLQNNKNDINPLNKGLFYSGSPFMYMSKSNREGIYEKKSEFNVNNIPHCAILYSISK